MRNNLLYGRFKLLADGGYPGEGPLIIPYTDRRAGDNEMLLAFNERQRAQRVVVEETIGELKQFHHCIESKWRHQRSLLPMCVNITAGFCNRYRHPHL